MTTKPHSLSAALAGDPSDHSVAQLLKDASNIYMAGVVAKDVASDLLDRAAAGVQEAESEAARFVWRSPYRAAGVGLLLGFIAGVFIRRRFS